MNPYIESLIKMNPDIEFLHDFILYDREHLEDLYEPLYLALQAIGDRLRRKFPSLTIIYKTEDSPMYELIELLDGNNFEIKYGQTVFGYAAVEAIPLYPETNTPTATVELEIEATEHTSDIPEVRNPPRRGLRAKTLLLDEALFDESLKPP